MRIMKVGVCVVLLLLGTVSSIASDLQAGQSREEFWEKFRAAVIKRDKTAVANMAQFPISMPYGMRSVRSKAQLIKRYRDVFNHEGDAAVCFAESMPVVDPARPRQFSVGCKNSAGDEVVIYSFALTKLGWRFNGLDNINE
jgi:hypothetical protein